VAKFRKARAAHKPDVPSPNNRNTHGVVILGHGRLGNRKEGALRLSDFTSTNFQQ
jgi:hypothetical protein